MIVEFTGSTSAGKSTLIQEVNSALEESASVVTASDIVLGRWGLENLVHPTAQNLIQDVAGFLSLPVFSAERRSFLRYAMRTLVRRRPFELMTLNYGRSILRAVGVDEVVSRVDDGPIVLVDEGTFHTAYSLLIMAKTFPAPEEIEEFARRVPLSDLVVHVRAPADILKKRILARSDPPRELRSRDPRLVESHISRAVAVFDAATRAPRIEPRVMAVSFTAETRDKTSRDVADTILERRSHAP